MLSWIPGPKREKKNITMLSWIPGPKRIPHEKNIIILSWIPAPKSIAFFFECWHSIFVEVHGDREMPVVLGQIQDICNPRFVFVRPELKSRDAQATVNQSNAKTKKRSQVSSSPARLTRPGVQTHPFPKRPVAELPPKSAMAI